MQNKDFSCPNRFPLWESQQNIPEARYMFSSETKSRELAAVMCRTEQLGLLLMCLTYIQEVSG